MVHRLIHWLQRIRVLRALKDLEIVFTRRLTFAIICFLFPMTLLQLTHAYDMVFQALMVGMIGLQAAIVAVLLRSKKHEDSQFILCIAWVVLLVFTFIQSYRYDFVDTIALYAPSFTIVFWISLGPILGVLYQVFSTLIGLWFFDASKTENFMNFFKNFHLDFAASSIIFINMIIFTSYLFRQYKQETLQLRKVEAKNIHLNQLSLIANRLMHEVNNPLAIISFAANSMTHRLKLNDEQKFAAQSLSHKIQNNVERIQDITKLIYAYASKPQVSSRVKVDFDQLMSSVFRKHLKRYPKAMMRVQIKNPGERVAYLSKDELIQIVEPIIENSFCFASNPNSLQIEVFISIKSEQVEIRIKDNGPGIDPEQTSLIFDPFYQITFSNNNLGMGLAMARYFTDALEGHIKAESLSKGLLIEIHLPLPLLT